MKTAKPSAILFSSLVILLGGAAAGCGISVEADVPEIEVTQHDLAFAGVPVAALIGDVSMTRTFSQEHKKLEMPDGLDTEVKALGITLTTKTGIKDFGFIHNLRLLMSDDVHDPIELVDFQQDPTTQASNVLTMSSANPVNTLDQWKTNSATFTVEIAGTLPPQDWTIDLSIRFAGKVKYSY
jgi:hypothetical protein